ncbi:MAG: metallophosphoesterase [Acidobacteriia bacterium]|jgi:Icc-related predicted phosphoesterase|nr:metallophosphoesterase [Terriglobia bacterium]
MRVLVFSDIHGDVRALERLVAQPADVYIAAGDLSTFGRGLERIGEILRPLGQRCWVLPGNHETEQEIRDFCGRYGLAAFHRQVRQLEGGSGVTHWAGLGYSNPTPFDTPGEYTEEEITEALAAFDAAAQTGALYLVVHFPPHGTRLDEVARGRHAGSRALRAWVERWQPRQLFCGHIHECAGRSDRLGATECFNVGKAGHLVTL